MANITVRKFEIKFSDKELTDLKNRVKQTRWPEKETVLDDTQGVQLATMKRLADHWVKRYDWRKIETKLNSYPNFITNIDGLDIHFIHVRSKHKNALPVIITHGWPGSIIEQLKVIEPLTDPVSYGGKESDAFDVVIPSLPGYGFSGKPTKGGWNPVRIAAAWDVLMKHLGYTRYVAQGGDWGNAVSEQMAVQAPEGLLGIHTNMPATVPLSIAKNLLSGGSKPSGLSKDENQAYEQLDFFYKKGIAYAQVMYQRSQTLYGIDDSPIGLAAWMLDHDAASYELIARVFDSKQEGLTREDVLDNITLYWLTQTGITSARLYWESGHDVPLRQVAFFAPTGIKIPVAVSAFPDELYTAPLSWTKKAYPKLIHYKRLSKGGHFAAWEQPMAFTAELRESFRSLR